MAIIEKLLKACITDDHCWKRLLYDYVSDDIGMDAEVVPHFKDRNEKVCVMQCIYK